jgi:hypothetical protein
MHEIAAEERKKSNKKIVYFDSQKKALNCHQRHLLRENVTKIKTFE